MQYVKPERRPELDRVVKYLLENTDTDVGVENDFRIVHPFLYACEKHLRTQYTDADNMLKLIVDVNLLPNGDLNYILFKYCLISVIPSYNNYKSYIGNLTAYANGQRCHQRLRDEIYEAVTEIRRRILGPYEDQKIQENGDVIKDLLCE